MKQLTTLLTITLLLLAMNGSAQEVTPLSLQDCINYALQHTDTIKNARINVEIQKAQNAQVASAALPRISGHGDFTYFFDPQQTLLPGEFFPGGQPGTFVPIVFTPRLGAIASLSGSQTLIDGALFVALKARKEVVELVRQTGQLTEENLRYGVQRAYYSIVIARRNYDILLRSLAVVRNIDRDVNALHNSGFNELLDVQRSRVQVNNLETDSSRIESIIASSEQLLKYQIGMDINTPIVLTDTLIEDYLLHAADLLNSPIDYNNRTEFKLLNSVVRLNEYQLKRYQYAALPTLAASGQMGYNYSSNEFRDLTQFRKNYLFSSFVGLQLNVPIFSGFMRRNQVKEARFNIEKSKNNLHFLELSLDFQHAQAQTALKNALLATESQKRNLDLSNSIVDLANKKYKAGVGSSLEVNQAQTDLLRSQTNYFQALLDIVNAQADIQRALGQFK